MKDRISFNNSLVVYLYVYDCKLKAFIIESTTHSNHEGAPKDILPFNEGEVYHTNIDGDHKRLYIKGINIINALDIARSYLDTMGIEYDNEIFGE